jgi:UDP-N-acetylglucosamine transferase subunit ALG13
VIFVTVGHQMPFDRLVRAFDAWAGAHPERSAFAQIGAGEYVPTNLPFQRFVSPAEFARRVEEASAIVAHAGTGTIIAALRLAKPLLVVPRRADLGETRNDHQIATCQWFEAAGYLLVAGNELDLPEKIEELDRFTPIAPLADRASPELTARLRAFAFGVE